MPKLRNSTRNSCDFHPKATTVHMSPVLPYHSLSQCVCSNLFNCPIMCFVPVVCHRARSSWGHAVHFVVTSLPPPSICICSQPSSGNFDLDVLKETRLVILLRLLFPFLCHLLTFGSGWRVCAGRLQSWRCVLTSPTRQDMQGASVTEYWWLGCGCVHQGSCLLWVTRFLL